MSSANLITVIGELTNVTGKIFALTFYSRGIELPQGKMALAVICYMVILLTSKNTDTDKSNTLSRQKHAFKGFYLSYKMALPLKHVKQNLITSKNIVTDVTNSLFRRGTNVHLKVSRASFLIIADISFEHLATTRISL